MPEYPKQVTSGPIDTEAIEYRQDSFPVQVGQHSPWPLDETFSKAGKQQEGKEMCAGD